MKNWVISVLSMVLLLALCGLLNPIVSLFKEVPLSVTMRQGILSDYVLQVNNKSADTGYAISVYVQNASDSTRSAKYFLRPSETKEFGKLEMQWDFKKGDYGYVAIEGNLKKIFFWTMPDDKYRTVVSVFNFISEEECRSADSESTAKEIE